MLDYSTALIVAEKMVSIAADAIRCRGDFLSWESHLLPLFEEHYVMEKISKLERNLIATCMTGNLGEELQTAGAGIADEEITQSVITLRMAGLVLLCEQQLKLKIREEMKVQ